MGNSKGRSNEKPVHKVTVSDFWMMKTEVTRKDFEVLMGKYKHPGRAKGEDLPVVVSWYDAVAYANKLSVNDRLRPAYTISGKDVNCDWNASGWRLPTEAEWEFAALGGLNSQKNLYSGSNKAEEVAWYQDNSGGQVHAVGTKKANELGLYDMSGNVWEWCWDWYEKYTSGSQTDPKGSSSGTGRVLRGGSWRGDTPSVRSASRGNGAPDDQSDYFGFRLVRPRVR
jgi:formylglycine-generating enzyme required for sulfatase activity